jgi:glycosyltransferase involved in cell wall biosynthesis
VNIAHLLPHSAQFPLKKHNGRYEWVLRLAKLQATAGHTVSIYAAPDSHDDSLIQWRSIESQSADKITNNVALMSSALGNSEHDIYHSHFDSLHFGLAHLTSKPIVVTQHWFPTDIIAQAARTGQIANIYTVPVTHFMEDEDARLGIPTVKMLYEGVDLSLFKPSTMPRSDRLIFVGRISPNKGVREAVRLARRTGQALDIVGKVNDADMAYWEEILPLVDGDKIKYLGTKSQTEVAQLFASAKAFLFPSQEPEAFGQVTIEAQACGTPVIISDVGASKELVQQGMTGFVCKTEEEYLEALNSVTAIDSSTCRSFAKQFDIGVMVREYENLYKNILSL